MPSGSERYWSWLFAAREAREPLLGMYALLAEWRALADPATESSVAHIKLAWWRDEIRRLADRSPAHPITRYVAELPHAAAVDFTALDQSLLAAGAQVAGVPLERTAELAAHSSSLYGIPLLIAAALTAGTAADADAADSPDVAACIAPLAAAEYLTRSMMDYRRDAAAGRVPFPVDELLAAGIENADLSAREPPPSLQQYLSTVRARAAGHFAEAANALQSLPPVTRSGQRHLAILAILGAKHLSARQTVASADFRVFDLYNAWTAARRAVRGR